ncbi:MAG: S8 family serine peptidase [Chroococcidiopsidaceae cyanobacterium CP_BM_ER_R8_30]|nr:S8 family serine peptidase [Chroococcidiopsidaceae cyanobacterium CP_BM_ER_R8_30]
MELTQGLITTKNNIAPTVLTRVLKLATLSITVALGSFVTNAQAATYSLPIVQAAQSTQVDAIRNLGYTGAGIKIGILSNSFNTATAYDAFGNLDNYAFDVSKGYLPTGIQDLNDFYGSANQRSTDEGRAMAEIVHAVAPGASIAFYTTNGGPAGMGAGIEELKAAGANIIVDDVSYSGEQEPPYGPINQAIQAVVSQGASYFTSVGNSAQTNQVISGHANNPYVMTVGAVYDGNQKVSQSDRITLQGQLEPFSAYASQVGTKPNIAAPDGLGISFNLDGSSPSDKSYYAYDFFGTSAAAPFSAAVAALLLQAVPSATNSQIYAALENTAQPLDSYQPGNNYDGTYGLIQANQALRCLKYGGTCLSYSARLNSSSNTYEGNGYSGTNAFSEALPQSVPEPSSMFGIAALAICYLCSSVLQRCRTS